MTYAVFRQLAQAAAANKVDTTSVDISRNWFKTKTETLSFVTPTSIIRTAPTKSSMPMPIGSMQLFAYDPKTKDKLPYYDRFPLIFMTDVTPDGFTGINMHYIPPSSRAILMDALYDIAGSESTDTLAISYQLLKSTHRLKLFQPCFKRYLNSNVRSNFALIEKESWNIALLLPLARFEKSNDAHVHSDSMKKVNHGQ